MYKIKFSVNKIEYLKEFECSYENYVIKMKNLINELIDKNVFVDNNEILVFKDKKLFEYKQQNIQTSLKYWCDTQRKLDIPFKYQELVLYLWGQTLYLNYDYLVDFVEIKNIVSIESEIDEFLNIMKNDTGEDCEDILEHLSEGGRFKGKSSFGKNFIDNSLLLLFEKLSEPLTIYRTTNVWNKNYKGFVSTTTEKDAFYDSGERKKFNLPVGFPIINTERNGVQYCDEDEVIVRYEDLMLLNQNNVI